MLCMTGLLVVLIPLLLLLFAFAMERIEASLLRSPGAESAGIAPPETSGETAEESEGIPSTVAAA